MNFSSKTKAIVAAVVPAIVTVVTYFAADNADVVVVMGAVITVLSGLGVYAAKNTPA